MSSSQGLSAKQVSVISEDGIRVPVVGNINMLSITSRRQNPIPSTVHLAPHLCSWLHSSSRALAASPLYLPINHSKSYYAPIAGGLYARIPYQTDTAWHWVMGQDTPSALGAWGSSTGIHTM